MSSLIRFVSAQNGGLEFTTEDGTTFQSAVVAELVEFATENGFSRDQFMGSSTMDFADEAGFEFRDGAEVMLNAVLFEVNGGLVAEEVSPQVEFFRGETRNLLERVVSGDYPDIAEYGQVRANGWPVSSYEVLAQNAKGGRLVKIGRGYEIAGSAMRWCDGSFAYHININGTRHGQRFRTLELAQERFERASKSARKGC